MPFKMATNEQQQICTRITKGDIVRPELLCDKGEFLTKHKMTKLMSE